MKGNAVLRKLYVVVAAGALLALAAGVSYAAIPSAGGLISACKAKDGSIKLIDKEAGQNCSGDKQLVEWNKQGLAGQNGVSGYETVFATSATDSNHAPSPGSSSCVTTATTRSPRASNASRQRAPMV